jgi:hypothetical protein
MQLITSIPPRLSRRDNDGRDVGIDYQSRCIKSWLASGFDVCSVNLPGEDFSAPPEIERVFSEERGYYSNRYGPALGAAFSVARQDQIAITNADIYLARLEGGAQTLSAMARDAFIFSQRVDVSSLDGLVGAMYPLGIDLIAFDRHKFAPLVNDPGLRKFQFGCPWWDYVVPIAASFFGPVKRLTPPLIFHHAHEFRWHKEDQEAMAEAAQTVLLRLARQAGTPLARDFIAKAENTGGDRRAFSVMCIDWLFASEVIEDAPPPVCLDDPVAKNWFVSMCRQQGRTPLFHDGKPVVRTLSTPDLSNPPSFSAAWTASRADVALALFWSGKAIERAARPYLRKIRGIVRPHPAGKPPVKAIVVRDAKTLKTSAATARGALLSGFSAPENNGRWIVEPTAEIAVNIPPGYRKRKYLTVTFDGFWLSRGHDETASIRLGNCIQTIDLQPKSKHVFFSLPSAELSEGETKLVLEFPHYVKLSDQKQSRDDRTLHFFLRSMTFRYSKTGHPETWTWRKGGYVRDKLQNGLSGLACVASRARAILG